MDNIGDYIIIIFFVVSAIASLLKKKSEQTSKKDTPVSKGDSPVILQQKDTRVQQKKYDPFQEYRDIFNDHKDTEEEVSEVDKYFEQALKKSEELKQVIQPKQVIYQSIHNRTKQVEFEEPHKIYGTVYNQNNKKVVNKKTQEIIDKLKNPKLMRDLVLLNEIIGKPKVLRRK